jgi:hydrogenase expression/formation protein HypC
MCLGIPGQVVRIEAGAGDVTMGTVSFGGIRKEVCLAYVPGVAVGDYVLVHVGFALSKIDENEAHEVFRLLEELGQTAEIRESGERRDEDAP